MAKKPDEDFVSREEAAASLEALAVSIRQGDKETRVAYSIQFSFRRFPSSGKEASS